MAVAHIVRRPQPQPSPPVSFNWIIAAVGAVDTVVIAVIRRTLLAKSEEKSKRDDAAAARAGWFSAQVLGFAGGMSIVLFGFVLNVMGARPAWISTAFFIAGLLILVGYRPQLSE